MFDPGLFQRKADIRGIYPNQINEEMAWLTGRYLARSLKKLLAANKRLNTAYLLKESFGQL